MSEADTLVRDVRVNISYGPNSESFDVPADKSVCEILVDPFIMGTVGYENSKENVVTVNGTVVDDLNICLKEGDQVEVVRRAGRKA